MGIIIPDSLAHAEIWVMTVDKAFHVDETRNLLTVIPFQIDDWSEMEAFRKEVFEVADALSKTYYRYPDTISIEVKFKNNYVNC